MANIIDGKVIAEGIKSEVKAEVAVLAGLAGRSLGNGANAPRPPALAVVLVGDDPASAIYVRNKEKACEFCGMTSIAHRLPAETTQDELLRLIDGLNADKSVDGILVQLPLPAHIDEGAVVLAVSPEKDVDCFHPVNAGRVFLGAGGFAPCTPAGVVELLKRSQIEIAGKRAVVVGRSNIVGKPAAMLLLGENATVTVCHSKTRDLPEICREADILVAAVGRPQFFTRGFVKDGAAVIDVGIHKVGKKTVGDVDFDDVAPIAGAITPVPGGVGPMTIAMLMKNCLEAYRRNVK